MSLNWITEKELNEIPFDTFLLLEECQLNWIDEERYADAWGLALRAHPYVVWAIAKRAPQKAAWAERMLKHGKALPPADTQALFQAERTLLRAYEDWIAYAVNPEIYHRQPFLQWDERELTGLCDFAGKRVVDVGSGTGKQAFAVAPLCKAVYCVEPAWSLRRFLRERAEREHVKNLYVADGLMESLPVEDGFADLITSGHVFGDSPDAELAEMLRVTKPGGMVILIPGNNDCDNAVHHFLTDIGFAFGRFEEPGDGWKRKYWLTKG